MNLESDCPDDDTSSNDDYFEPEYVSEQKLYPFSTQTLKQFNILFMSLLTTLNLPETHAETLYEFIRLILPTSHILAESYYRFKKSFNFKMIKEIKLCHICHLELTKTGCPSHSCFSHKEKEQKINLKKSIKIVVADVKSQLDIILRNHHLSILNYKSKQSCSYLLVD